VGSYASERVRVLVTTCWKVLVHLIQHRFDWR
jgi:hypothetical protein